MLSSRCSLSRCFFCSFSRAFQSGRKECSSVCFNEDIRDMSFSPNTKQNKSLTENNESATENRFITSQKSLSFRSFPRSLLRLSFGRSLSFSSQKAFVVVPLIKDLIAKRERFSVKLFQITFKEIHTELGIHTSAEPTAWHPMYRLPTFRALVQRYQFERCRLRLFLRA